MQAPIALPPDALPLKSLSPSALRALIALAFDEREAEELLTNGCGRAPSGGLRYGFVLNDLSERIRNCASTAAKFERRFLEKLADRFRALRSATPAEVAAVWARDRSFDDAFLIAACLWAVATNADPVARKIESLFVMELQARGVRALAGGAVERRRCG